MNRPLDPTTCPSAAGSEDRIQTYARRRAAGLLLFHPGDSPEIQLQTGQYGIIFRCSKCGRKWVTRCNAICGICRFHRKAERAKRPGALLDRVKPGAPADGTDAYRFGDLAALAIPTRDRAEK